MEKTSAACFGRDQALRLRLSTDSASGNCHSAYPHCAKFDQSAYGCKFSWQRWSNAAKEGKLGSLRPLFGTAVRKLLLHRRSTFCALSFESNQGVCILLSLSFSFILQLPVPLSLLQPQPLTIMQFLASLTLAMTLAGIVSGMLPPLPLSLAPCRLPRVDLSSSWRS